MPNSRGSPVVLDAPSNLGLKPPGSGRVPGVHKLPSALRAAGLVMGLKAADAGGVPAPAYSPAIDPATGIRNAFALRSYALELAKKVGPLVEAGAFPVVLGGDCSILLGNLLALRRLGRYGLFFIDGHTDLQTPRTSQTGGAAGMDLALATGRGPALLADLAGLRPLVREADVVVFGYRDAPDEDGQAAEDIFETDMQLYDLDRIRRMGLGRAVETSLAALRDANADLEGLWIHLDADALDDAVMPAVDSRQPGGLSYAELVELLQRLRGSGLAVGLEVTIFDPELDADGKIAREFAKALVAGLQ